MAALLIYLAEAAKRPWAWGSVDCCMFAGDWIRQTTGIDPVERFRGKYRSAGAAHRLIRRCGGFVHIVGAELDRYFPRTNEPKSGDVGIIDAPVVMADRMPVVGAIMAIRSGPRWVARALYGLQASDYSCPHAWSIG